MKKILLIIASLSISFGFSQNFSLTTDTVNLDCTSGGVLFDSGGAGGDYSDNESFVFTVCPDAAGFGVFASMTEIDIPVGDELTLYNGNSTSAPSYPDMPLDNNTSYNLGAQFQATVANPSGCLTFEFTSNGDGMAGSFQFTLECEARCQEVISQVSSTIPDTVSEGTDVYVNICLGDTLFVNGNALFPDNNVEYAQSEATSVFTWNWGDETPSETGQNLFHYFDEPGGYLTSLQVIDVNGCVNFQNQFLKIRVAPEPTFVPLEDSLLCLGETDTLVGLPEGIIVNGQVVQGDTVYFVPPFFSGDSLPLPDGNGAGYNTSTFVSSFNNTDTISDCGDIIEICVNMEHSFLGDLEMSITCPNGQSVILLENPNTGGGTFLGDPVDETTGAQVVGNGLEYCFNSGATTMLVNGPTQASNNPGPPATNGNTIVPGDYLPFENFTNLIGCPINGQWTLNITDNLTIDDGFLFSWELNIHPCLYPQVDSFTMNYDFGYWSPSSTIVDTIGNNNTILIEPDSIGPFSYTYHTQNQFGCEYENTYNVDVDGFEVQALPADTMICEDTIQLSASILGDVSGNCEISSGSCGSTFATIVGSSGANSIESPYDGFWHDSRIQLLYTAAELNALGFNSGNIDAIGFQVLAKNSSAPYNGFTIKMQCTSLTALPSSFINTGFSTVFGPQTYTTIPGWNIHTFPNAYTWDGVSNLLIEVCFDNTGFTSEDVVSSSVTTFNSVSKAEADNSTGCTMNWERNLTTRPNIRIVHCASEASFVWTPNTDISDNMIANPLVWPSSSTEYIVSSTNSNNCTYSDTATINIGGNFQHDISNDTIICEGDTVQLEVTGGALTVAWTPNDGSISDTTIANPLFYPTTTTTYFAELDSNSCATFESVTVFVSDLEVDSTVVNNESCAGANDGSIQIFASNGIGTTQYSIDNGVSFGDTALFQNLAAGTYDIVVTDSASCDTSYQVTILGGSPLDFDSIVIVDPLCGDVNDGTISIYASGGVAPFTFSVDSGASYVSDSVFTGLAGTSYNVFVQDFLGCAMDSLVTLNQPDTLVINLVQNDSLSCYDAGDGAVQVSASGGVGAYEFSIDGTTFAAASTFNALDAGIYSLYVRDDNQCIDSLTVNVGQPDSLYVSNVMVDSTDCNGSPTGSSISFSATGGTSPYTYAISGTFGTNNVFNDINAGNYQLEVLDANGCSGNTVDTTVFEPTLLEFVLDSTLDATCGDSNGAIYVHGIGGIAPYSYSINSGLAQSTGDFENLTAGAYTIVISDANSCDTTQVVNLSGFPAADIGLVNNDSVSCFGLSDGLIEVQANAGTSPFEFSIDNGTTYQASGLFNNLLANTYNIILRDSLMCTDTLSSQVFQPAVLDLSAVSDSVSCFGASDGTVTLTASGGTVNYSYSISNDAGLQSSNILNGLSAANYNAYVVDANGCRDTVGIVVNEPDSLIITSTTASHIDCFGDADGSITVNVSGGSPSYSYSVDNVSFQSSNVLTSLNGGIYTIFVADANSCSATSQDSIYEPADLTLMVDSSSNITCNGGSDGYLEVGVAGGNGSYEFSMDGLNFQTSNAFSGLSAGAYVITVRDANGCLETLNLNLTQPNALAIVIDVDNLACFGDTDGSITITSISGETAPYNVVLDAGTPQVYVPGLTFDNLGSGTYFVEVQDSNGCPTPAYSESVTITSPSIFELDTVIAMDPLCFGGNDGSITLVGVGGIPSYDYYIFNAGDTTNNASGVFNNLEAGDYAVWILDQNGCSDQDALTLDQPIELSLQIDTAINPSCFGYDDGQIWVSASGGTPFTTGTSLYTYTLSDGTEAMSGAFPNLAELFSYEITVTDANGCTDTELQALTDPDPVFAEISPEDPFIEMGDTLSFSVVSTNAAGTNYAYAWSPAIGLSCTDCANPLVSVNNSQEYTLSFTDENGCSTTTTVFVEVSDTLRYFIPNAFTPGSFDDINNLFAVYGQDLKYVDMMIFNRWGEKLYEASNALNSWDGTYQGIMQNSGVYTYYVKLTFLNEDTVEEKGSVTLIR